MVDAEERSVNGLCVDLISSEKTPHMVHFILSAPVVAPD